jgi:hypothetical protein
MVPAVLPDWFKIARCGVAWLLMNAREWIQGRGVSGVAWSGVRSTRQESVDLLSFSIFVLPRFARAADRQGHTQVGIIFSRS